MIDSTSRSEFPDGRNNNELIEEAKRRSRRSTVVKGREGRKEDVGSG
jgi:hypothetical protein